jgi:hypothetical protein
MIPPSPAPICTTCGTQFPASRTVPDACAICDDERQYVPSGGQRWTSLDRLRRTHRNSFHAFEPGLMGIGTTPEFGIGQRALFVRTLGGNFLWDCIALLDQATHDILTAMGGIQGIAVSHPHYYTTMVEWSHAFGGVPVYLHEGDREWVMRPDPVIQFWDGASLSLSDEFTLVHCGGHFEGGTVSHWRAGAGGRGALLSGDVVQVVSDRRSVSFMRSYPNLVPLGAAAIHRIVASLAPYRYDRVYGAWWDRVIERGGEGAVATSAARYLAAIGDQEARA